MKSNTKSSTNLLILYILQCRAQNFIEQFEAQRNRCFGGVYSLYMMAYSNYLLLSEDLWLQSCMAVIEQCRKGCREILDYLQHIMELPDTFEADLRAYMKRYACYADDDDFDYMLDADLPKLLSLGYRKVDCLLYVAGMKLNYDEVEILLALGADPNVKIYGDYTAAQAAEASIYDVYCVGEEANNRVSDAVDLYGVYGYWESGVNGENKEIGEDDLYYFFQGAAYRLMVMILCGNHLNT